MKKDQLKGGISAMFGDGSQTAPKGVQLTDEEYEILEERQSQRRAFLTGRRGRMRRESLPPRMMSGHPSF